MKRIHTHYDNLKVTRDAPAVVIRAAYRALCRQYHPDRNPDKAEATRIMSIINASYAVLSDPEQRRQHDLWIGEEEHSHGWSRSAENDYRYPEPRSRPAPAQQAEAGPRARQEAAGRAMQETAGGKRGVKPDAQPRRFGVRAAAALCVGVAVLCVTFLYIRDKENRALALENVFSRAIPAKAGAAGDVPNANLNQAIPFPNRSPLDWEKK